MLLHVRQRGFPAGNMVYLQTFSAGHKGFHVEQTLTPHTPAALADALADAATLMQPITPYGSGMHQHLGAPPPPDALLLSTAALNQVLDYEPADLTATLQAGVRLADVQALLRANGQWLPWEPPGAATATIGGLLAAGQTGPLRLGYGTPRDRVLGMRVALGDGRLVKSGGRVVKNVAGFDTHKLHIGALGTLGVIVEATFKLAPLPECDITLVVSSPIRSALLDLAERLRARPFAPAALLLCCPSAVPALADRQHCLLLRLTGVERAVERQRIAATEFAAAVGCRVEPAPPQAWEQARDFLMPPITPQPSNGRTQHLDATPALLLRVGVPPAQLAAALGVLERHAPDDAALIGSIGVGLIAARWPLSEDLSTDAVAFRVAQLRRDLAERNGYAVIEYVPAPLRAGLDLWGPPPPTIDLMQSLKTRWDPQCILNRGRYLGGI